METDAEFLARMVDHVRRRNCRAQDVMATAERNHCMDLERLVLLAQRWHAGDGTDLARVEALFAMLHAPFDRSEPSEACEFPNDGTPNPPDEATIALKCGMAELLFTSAGAFLGVSWFAPDETMAFTPRRS